MRATAAVLLMALGLAPAPVRAQTAPGDGLPGAGPPDAAFSGGPLRLSKTAAAALRAHYLGDHVPLVPQPFRTRLDTALAARDWPRVEAARNELTAARGIVVTLAWEQSRLIATGGVGLAELHARDIAATGSSGVAETAAMLWLYAAAAALTDGHKCADPAAIEAHLAQLGGPQFNGVLRVVHGVAADRLAALRDLAIRLETVLAADRTDDTVCRAGPEKPEVRTDSAWRAEAAKARTLLPKTLTAFAAVERLRPMPPEPPKAARPGAAPPRAGTVPPSEEAMRRPPASSPPAAGASAWTVPSDAPPAGVPPAGTAPGVPSVPLTEDTPWSSEIEPARSAEPLVPSVVPAAPVATVPSVAPASGETGSAAAPLPSLDAAPVSPAAGASPMATDTPSPTPSAGAARLSVEPSSTAPGPTPSAGAWATTPSVPPTEDTPRSSEIEPARSAVPLAPGGAEPPAPVPMATVPPPAGSPPPLAAVGSEPGKDVKPPSPPSTARFDAPLAPDAPPHPAPSPFEPFAAAPHP